MSEQIITEAFLKDSFEQKISASCYRNKGTS